MQPIIGRYILLFLSVLLFSGQTFSQNISLQSEIEEIIAQADGQVGVAIIGPDYSDKLIFNADIKFPMQSVYKFPLALTVLKEVDNGSLSLDQKIHVEKQDLLPNTGSPLREKYPDGNIDISLSELLTFTVSQSDNNGCDILFRLLGGPAIVDRFISNLGIEGMSIINTEEEMHADQFLQYKNYSTPEAMLQLLHKFSEDSLLSASSKNFLWNVMAETVTGPGRIKGKLPVGTVVAHKTGSSGMNESGLAAATNDVGIIMLPNGKKIILVVFVKDCGGDDATRDAIIADIAKAAWEKYSGY